MPRPPYHPELILDPLTREVEPKQGDLGHVRMFAVPGSVDESKRTMRFVCSTRTIDRYGEIVEPKAFKPWLDTFMLNPVMCAGHVFVAPDGKPTTIGEWLSLDITGETLEGVVQFMDEDGLAELYWNRYRKRVQRAVSVVFITHKWEMRDVEIEGATRRVRVFTEAELLSIDPVAIPANRLALAKAASYLGALGDASTDVDAARSTSVDMGALAKALQPAVERAVTEQLDTGPGGRLCALVQDVVEIALCHAGLGVDAYDIPAADDEPDPAADAEGDALKTMLRDALDASGGS